MARQTDSRRDFSAFLGVHLPMARATAIQSSRNPLSAFSFSISRAIATHNDARLATSAAGMRRWREPVYWPCDIRFRPKQKIHRLAVLVDSAREKIPLSGDLYVAVSRPGSCTPSPSQNRTGTSRLIRLPSSSLRCEAAFPSEHTTVVPFPPDAQARAPHGSLRAPPQRLQPCRIESTVIIRPATKKARPYPPAGSSSHRAIKRRCAALVGSFKSFRSAAVTLAGIELAHRLRKKQFSFGRGR